jgi:branched-chain amino acid aminotransferase
VFDHGLLYGDGIFEGIRVYNGRVFRLKEHIDRLYASARAINLDIGMPHADMMALVEEALKKSGLRDAYIRPLVTRGVGDLGIDPINCKKPTIMIIVDTIRIWPEERYEQGSPASLRRHRSRIARRSRRASSRSTISRT